MSRKLGIKLPLFILSFVSLALLLVQPTTVSADGPIILNPPCNFKQDRYANINAGRGHWFGSGTDTRGIAVDLHANGTNGTYINNQNGTQVTESRMLCVTNSPALASLTGTANLYYDSLCGYGIKLVQGDIQVLYCHLENNGRVSGSVQRGQVIGVIGGTGSGGGYNNRHIHLEVSRAGTKLKYRSDHYPNNPNEWEFGGFPAETIPCNVVDGNTICPVYRFWSTRNNGHFYTASAAEKDYVMTTYTPYTWQYEQVAFKAFTAKTTANVPVYRFLNRNSGGHFYTANESEKNSLLTSTIWQYEGVVYYAYPKNSTIGVPVHQFWSDNFQKHFYSATQSEVDNLRANPSWGWAYEGVVFKGAL